MDTHKKYRYGDEAGAPKGGSGGGAGSSGGAGGGGPSGGGGGGSADATGMGGPTPAAPVAVESAPERIAQGGSGDKPKTKASGY